MALRLLILALLVTAFARPYLTRMRISCGTSNNRAWHHCSNSYSMRYGELSAEGEARRRIDAMGSGDQMAMIAFKSATCSAAFEQRGVKAAIDTRTL